VTYLERHVTMTGSCDPAVLDDRLAETVLAAALRRRKDRL
jgi:hypothetical protein